MIKTIILVIIIIFTLTSQTSSISRFVSEREKIKTKLMNNNWPEHLTDPITMASFKWGLEPELILALIFTESSFLKYAKSSKNYHGYMQIEKAIYNEYANIDLGGKILKEKLLLANGNMYKALHYYKGYKIGSKKGAEVVKRTLRIAKTLRENGRI